MCVFFNHLDTLETIIDQNIITNMQKKYSTKMLFPQACNVIVTINYESDMCYLYHLLFAVVMDAVDSSEHTIMWNRVVHISVPVVQEGSGVTIS